MKCASHGGGLVKMVHRGPAIRGIGVLARDVRSSDSDARALTVKSRGGRE
jgi:hypothetical protein